MPPKYVKAYVKRGKHDAADAEAICEAVTRPSMREVAVKSVEQQAVLVVHRTRDQLVRQRTQLVNALRAHLAASHSVVSPGLSARCGLHPIMSVVKMARKNPERNPWAIALLERMSYRAVTVAVAVAVANKMARIIWALMVRGGSYQAEHQPAAMLAARS